MVLHDSCNFYNNPNNFIGHSFECLIEIILRMEMKMSKTYERILLPLNNKEPKYGHAYINKLQRIESKKTLEELPKLLKASK